MRDRENNGEKKREGEMEASVLWAKADGAASHRKQHTRAVGSAGSGG